MRLHLIGNGIFIVLLVPAIIWAARHYGAVGAGYAWLGLNLLYFTVWMPFVHMRFEPGLNMKWYVQDVLVIVAPATIAAYGLNHVLPYNDSRWMQLAEIIAIGLFAILIGAVASSEVRARVSRWFMLRQQKKRP